MSLQTAKMILDDASALDIKSISFGENGEPFTNPDAIEILRYAKKNLPDVEKIIYTNFSLLDSKKSEIITREKLVDKIFCNFDSLDKNTYKNIKSLDLLPSWTNFLIFLNNRAHYESKISVNIIAVYLNDYKEIVTKVLNKLPAKMKEDIDYSYDANAEAVLLRPLIFESDSFKNAYPVLWAERESSVLKEHKDELCPHLEAIKTDMIFAPDGSAYLCCLDSRCDLVYGNIYDLTIEQLANACIRLAWIKALEEKRFNDIGYPCNRVECCREYRVIR